MFTEYVHVPEVYIRSILQMEKPGLIGLSGWCQGKILDWELRWLGSYLRVVTSLLRP